MPYVKIKFCTQQVPVPLVSGPTSGRVFESEVEEWARQARRWTIGASEVFHYFIIKSRNIPFFTALSWGFVFFIYYGKIFFDSRNLSKTRKSFFFMALFITFSNSTHVVPIPA